MQYSPLKGRLLNVSSGTQHAVTSPAALPGAPAVGVPFVSQAWVEEHGLGVRGLKLTQGVLGWVSVCEPWR